LLTATGFAVAETETFTKTHDFADWTARSRTSEEAVAALTRMLLEAPGSTREAFGVVTEPDDTSRVLSFQDTKTLFVARKA
jgi:hypothetical protein